MIDIQTSSWRNNLGFTDFNLKKLSHRFFSFPTYNKKEIIRRQLGKAQRWDELSKCITVVVEGNFFVIGGFSPIDAPTHFNVIAA